MKPEEKAKELVKKFKQFKVAVKGEKILDITEKIMLHKSAKRCALTCVDFYLENNTSNACVYYGMPFAEYWQKVKEAINNL